MRRDPCQPTGQPPRAPSGARLRPGRRREHDAVEPFDAQANDEPFGFDHLLEERGLVLLAVEGGVDRKQLATRVVAASARDRERSASHSATA